MGAKDSKYLEAGDARKDTTLLDDLPILQTFFAPPKQITGLRVWYTTYIVGLEVFYDYQSTGVKFGRESLNAKVGEFVFSPNEHITKLEGRESKTGIELLIVRTNMDRSIAFGESVEGSAFELHHKGWPVTAFKVGVGACVQLLGAIFTNPLKI